MAGVTLAGATSVAHELPPGLLEEAQAAFTTGFNAAEGTSAVSIAILSILAAVILHHIGTNVGTSGGDKAVESKQVES